MNRMLKTARALTLVALAIILVGCGGSPTPTLAPTEDVSAVRTEVAKTVIAKITIEAALNPTSTTGPTLTPQTVVITATPEPAQPSSLPTATTAPTLAPTATQYVSGGGSGSSPQPTNTRRPGPDQASFIESTPPDGTKFNAGEVFDAVWTFKNIGTSTWNTTYSYRYASGAKLSDKKYYSFPKVVKPGETVKLIVDMTAPSSAGRYTTFWEMRNANGDVFGQFYIIIDVK